MALHDRQVCSDMDAELPAILTCAPNCWAGLTLPARPRIRSQTRWSRFHAQFADSGRSLPLSRDGLGQRALSTGVALIAVTGCYFHNRFPLLFINSRITTPNVALTVLVTTPMKRKDPTAKKRQGDFSTGFAKPPVFVRADYWRSVVVWALLERRPRTVASSRWALT